MPAKKTKKTEKKQSTTEVQASSVIINAPEVIVTGGVMKEKAIPFLVALVVISAFAVGLLYGKVSVYEQGLVAGVGTGGDELAQADNPNELAPADPALEEPVVLDDTSWQELLVNPAYATGDESAPVTIVEFTDYQCPFCARYVSETYGQLQQDYVDSGQVRYLLRDLPLSFHQNAKSAAIAARCAGDQGQYMEMHDALFENQEEWSNVSDPQENFITLATNLGLDATAFGGCYEGGEYDAAVDEDLALATKVGASGTPTFYVNGSQIVGAQPYSAFQQAIDAALAE